MDRTIKLIAGSILISVLEVAASYALQIAFFACSKNAAEALPMLFAGGAAPILLNVGFGFLNREKEWFEKKEALGIICFGSVIYVILMLLLFPHIEIPYKYIPRGEMALGFGQLLIQLLDCAGAAVCFVVSGIWLIYTRKKE